MKNLQIKVCGMRDKENIMQVVGLPINFIGFIFYAKSPRYVGEQIDTEILSKIPQHIKKIGVFVNESFENIERIVIKNKLQGIQLHGDESKSFCEHVKNQLNIEVIKAFKIDDNFDFESIESYSTSCDYFLFDTASKNHGGSGQKFDWNLLNKYKLSKPFFLSGGIGSDDEELISTFTNLPIYGVDLNSRFEISPGVKNVGLLEGFIKKVKSEK